jgi:hypothetical protein
MVADSEIIDKQIFIVCHLLALDQEDNNLMKGKSSIALRRS